MHLSTLTSRMTVETQAFPLLNMKDVNARIEPGALIRERKLEISGAIMPSSMMGVKVLTSAL